MRFSHWDETGDLYGPGDPVLKPVLKVAKHAFLSASGAPAWSRCEAKVWREKDLPEETSAYAEEGTRAHELLEICLRHVESPMRRSFEDLASEDMRREVDKTYSLIHDLSNDWEKETLEEQELDISFITGEPNATGKPDVVLISDTEIAIVDLKYGMGVEIEAEENEQLLIYGAAAIEKYDLTGDIKTLRMIISQPRLNHTSEWILKRNEVEERIDTLRNKAKRILAAKGGGVNLRATPGDKQCRFCRAKGTCPEYRGFALATVTDDFVDLDKPVIFLNQVKNSEERLPASDDTHLATCMQAVDMIEQWCVAVRKEVYKRLISGSFNDPRYKLVQGKRGHRKWIEEDAVKQLAEEYELLDELVEVSVKSPAQIEKQYKGTEFWEKAKEYIIQTEGRPTVVPKEDKRDPLDLILDFDPIVEEEYAEKLIGLTKE